MKIILGSGNRITIPKEIVQNLQLVYGQYLELQIINNQIILTKEINNSEEEFIAKDIKVFNNVDEENKDLILTTEDKIEIESTKAEVKRPKGAIYSNLEEAKNYNRKVYSDCGLLVRTKRSYLEKACERCKGKLVNESEDKNRVCKYLTSNTKLNSIENIFKIENQVNKKDVKKDIISKLTKNVAVLNKKLDKQITYLNSENNSEEEIKEENINLRPVRLSQFRKCEKCGEYYTSGFLNDKIFYCRKCTVEKFKNYLNKYKKERK